MTGERGSTLELPDAVRRTLDEFRRELGLDLDLWSRKDGARSRRLYPEEGADTPETSGDGSPVVRVLTPRDGPELELRMRGESRSRVEGLAPVLGRVVERTWDFAQEVRFFTYELAERYEEINLLYSISETLGSILHLDEAARIILRELCDVLGARRGSLWVFDPEEDLLHLTASVGEEGLQGPLATDDPDAVTSRVFREGRPFIADRSDEEPSPLLQGKRIDDAGSFLSVPIRYTPPDGESRTVGVINLIGRSHEGPFTASDQKLLSAIASQVGAALENNRLIRESLQQERVAREMELAHNLQMKLLPAVENFDGARAAARVEPAESVGGDFYQVFKLPEGRIGVMIGDVSSHGFPAALIMALSMSAATIYASEFGTPSKVLRHLDDALRDELESTEMYLTLFYGVLDPGQRCLAYSNAGHPHAFRVRRDGHYTRLPATDPPVGFAGPGSYGQEDVPWDADDDLLFLFTDGLSDTLTTESERGEEVVMRIVTEHREETPAEIVQALFDRAFNARPTIPSDDRTAIALRV